MRPTNSLYIPTTVNYKNGRYDIKRLVRDDPQENIEYWKQIIDHDIVLRKDGYLWFLVEVIDIEFEEL